MQKRFSFSTAILVVLLLSVLYGVGRVVNPPGQGGHDHDHEDQPAAQQTPATAKSQPAPPARPGAPPVPGQPAGMPNPAAPQDMMRQKMMAMQEQMKKEHAHETPAQSVRRQHVSDGMEPSLWQERDMGQVAAKPDTAK